MNDLPSDFERQLKLLKPVSPDHIQADTFYRAGWEACEANAGLAEPQQKSRLKRSVPTFGAGLLCGLMVSVALIGWTSLNQPASDDNTLGNQVVMKSGKPATTDHGSIDQIESENPDASDERQVDHIDESSGGIFVGETQPFEFFNNRNSSMSPEIRSLSPAAQSQFRRIVVASRESVSRSRVEKPVAQNDKLPLRSFPATDRMLEDYL